MKILKPFFLISVGLCISTLLHAQELQIKIAPKAEVKTVPAAGITNTASPQPEMKPMNGVDVKPVTEKAAETPPSPFTKDKSAPKPQAPKPIAPVAVTDIPAEKPAGLPVPGPVVIKEQ
jgi:hypothetical protein